MRQHKILFDHNNYTIFLLSVLAFAICVAEAANGRFKYIKRPMSKYSKYNQPETSEDSGDIVPSSEGEDPQPQDQPPSDDQPPPEEKPPPAEGPPPEDEQVAREQQPSQEDGNVPPPENSDADVARAASPPDGGEGMQNNDPPPLQGDSFSPASPEGEQGQPDYNSTPYPLSGESRWPDNNNEQGFGSNPPVLYTNELGEPVPNYSTLSPSIVSMRRTSTTIINGRRFKIPNIRRGWNRQSVISSGD